jgi:hypothetical protein
MSGLGLLLRHPANPTQGLVIHGTSCA